MLLRSKNKESNSDLSDFLSINDRNKGLTIFYDQIKGRCVRSQIQIPVNERVLEYRGELVSRAKALELEENYEKNQAGSYMFFFNFAGKKYW